MTTQLTLYNSALLHCKERKLASLTEAREPRRVLDTVWDRDAIRTCLEKGQWKFAIRTIKLEYDPSIQPPFGYTRAFEKPTDFVRVAGMCSDEFFNSPLLEFAEEAGYWFANIDQLYIRYVSDDNAFGRDYSLWPSGFTRYVEAYLAGEIVNHITSDEKLWAVVRKTRDDLLRDSRSIDAMAGPTVFPPQGSWVSSRRSWGGRNSGYDGGSRGSLY